MSLETTTVIAYVSLFTSILAVVLSSLIAPRVNAWFEQNYQDRKILKKTLRTLLDVEQYVHRKLSHPAIPDLSEMYLTKAKAHGLVKEDNLKEVSEGLPRFFEQLQPHVVELLPDKFEQLDKDFRLVLDELSTVDPLLAFQISERHILSPIQRANNVAVDVLKKIGVRLPDSDTQLLEQASKPLAQKLSDDLRNDLRTDILRVAKRISNKSLAEINLYFETRHSGRIESAGQLADEIISAINEHKSSKKEQANS